MKSRDSGFLLVLVFLAAVVAVAVFMFLMRPALATTSEAAERAEAAKDFNETLEDRLRIYEADFAKLPETQEQIAAIQQAFTPREDVPEVRRIISEILTTESLSLRNDSYGLPTLVAPGGVLLAPAAQAVGRTSYVEGLAFQDLYSTTVSLEFSGQYDSIIRAIARLQMNDSRYFLVRSAEIRKSEDEGSAGTFVATLEVIYFTLLDPTHKIDPGTVSGNIDPDTGERLPVTPPGSALTGGAPPPAPEPSTSTDDETSESSQG